MSSFVIDEHAYEPIIKAPPHPQTQCQFVPGDLLRIRTDYVSIDFFAHLTKRTFIVISLVEMFEPRVAYWCWRMSLLDSTGRLHTDVSVSQYEKL